MLPAIVSPYPDGLQIGPVSGVLRIAKNATMPYLLAFINLLVFLVGCGGGGAVSRPNPPEPPSPSHLAVTSVSPSSGPRSGGTPLTINGSGFVSGATVSIGGTSCSSAVVASDSRITCITGARSSGLADVVVTNPGGLSATLASGFKYGISLFVDGNGPNGLNKDVAQHADTPMTALLNGKLYVTWVENNAANGISQIRVAVYNGDDRAPAWAMVDGNAAVGLNKNPIRAAADPRLFVFNTKLYAVWEERSAANNATQIRVAVYNGGDRNPAWDFVDGNGTDGINKNAAKSAWAPQLAVFNSKLYATWTEADDDAVPEVRAVVYNGVDSAPSWTFVDGNSSTAGLNKNPAKSAEHPSLIAFNSKLYAAWEEVSSLNFQIRVAVYNGNDAAPVWNFVDGNGTNGLAHDPAASSETATLIVYNAKLYTTWVEVPNVGPDQLRAVVYNGSDSSPVWTFVDGNGVNGINHDHLLIAGNQRDFPALAVVGDTLYCSWQEGISPIFKDQIRVATYNGNDNSPAWLFADGDQSTGLNHDVSKDAGAVQLATLNSKLYLVWEEENANGKFQIRAATIQ